MTTTATERAPAAFSAAAACAGGPGVVEQQHVRAGQAARAVPFHAHQAGTRAIAIVQAQLSLRQPDQGTSHGQQRMAARAASPARHHRDVRRAAAPRRTRARSAAGAPGGPRRPDWPATAPDLYIHRLRARTLPFGAYAMGTTMSGSRPGRTASWYSHWKHRAWPWRTGPRQDQHRPRASGGGALSSAE